MDSTDPFKPAFGQADLSNCEQEQIHLAGSIQPHGALLLVDDTTWTVAQASVNAAGFIGLPESPVGSALGRIGGDLAECVTAHADESMRSIPVAFRCHAGPSGQEYDGLIHRPPEGGIVIELEHAGPNVSVAHSVEAALQTILASSSLQVLCDDVAKIIKDLSGYDRVMVYRFDEDGHGQVISESKEAELESFLGNRYPATDIPQIARRLYIENRVRVLVDGNYEPVRLEPRLNPLTGRDLDMSLCSLRSMSPIHIQYLKNMGVCATLVISLVVSGELWGLVACHHYVPKVVPYSMRAVSELLAESIATRITALESFVRADSELAVKRLEQRMVETISREGDWKMALFDGSNTLLQSVAATGAALLFEGQIQTNGEVPGTHQIKEISEWLSEREWEEIYSTAELTKDEPYFSSIAGVASGLLAARISNSPDDLLLWFRPEQVRTVTWGGDPNKAVEYGDDPSDLSPRRSFANWYELVEGTSERWSPANLSTARLIANTVSDIVLQLRSVRTLIAQEQLQSVSQLVQSSDRPVVITDPSGLILLTNEALEQLLPSGHKHLQHITDLPSLFSDAAALRRPFDELLSRSQAWRGEVALSTATGETIPLLLRADPVFASPNKLIGYVLIFTELDEEKRAEIARGRLQSSIVERRQVMTKAMSAEASIVYQDIMSSVVGNAQLAALEITDGVDVARMPEMLESVRDSVDRTAQLLEHLIAHSVDDGSSGES